MNAFILCTGRCGSTTFYKACKHIENYACGHESKTGFLGVERLNFPDNHIEVDNRLAWFLGGLGNKYPNAFYVHLKRDLTDTIDSLKDFGVVKWYGSPGVLLKLDRTTGAAAIIHDYVQTVSDNIEYFIRDKNCLRVDIENSKQLFGVFWKKIGAKGSLPNALLEFDIKHNGRNKT